VGFALVVRTVHNVWERRIPLARVSFLPPPPHIRFHFPLLPQVSS
jgi:hypothetical protein